ncbi:hypothetical protein COCC4DRAFT_173223 [Bipolaris maydis ATCC 48331]|uniref:Major facilitator superfamily (MFS) profile domain-containing protein n=2 Tax=Cochliobolus heterostrophus TaxID=5016 RepID=M2SRJ3_COCH5|nr:uncharacterized protein COCC4DRAFT_173223 [Bipolaris maydis ATCC 48331]EMD87920.1 hypothetical protein COCHEDRAFT_1206196 [Bipolaris maydis C5]KAJ5024204.1 major facilitator superfamily domain-containing protein [Bipolaris maydis]ENI03435.1 hypothetical protein COCC4DRAFT_173223 [Bipolaris maydis ATCC 48331]KAJ5057599.1 major facilitator superfamily domain-containing protein [Bipolaris maydis]KAJ6194850.1 major facilitator superfamily domain-containing protein [Bipolaris maydis]
MATQLPGESVEEGTLLLSPNELTHLLPPPPAKTTNRPWVFWVVQVLVMVTIIDVGAFLGEPPKTRIYETNLCLSYYREHDSSVIDSNGSISEKLCKIDAVQQKLAMIFGWQDTFDAIPSILLAIPFGTMADRVGRKWIFAASLLGCELSSAWVLLICYFKSLPLQLTWLSSAFYLIGGGPIVAAAVAMTMISDIVPPDKRTTVFLYLTASMLVAEMIAPAIAAKLMENGDWLPLLLALVIQSAGMCLAIFFPETLHMRDLPEPKDNVDQCTELQPKDGGFTPIAQLRNFQTAYTFLRKDLRLALIVFGFMANRLGRQAMSLLIRYASKRYDWEIKQAAYLLSFRAGTNLVVIGVFLPAINWCLLKHPQFSSHWADLWIARGSVIMQMVGFLLMGIAGFPALLILGLLVYNMGTGYNASLRSVAVNTVGGQSSSHVGKLMSTIAISEAIGAMFAGPALSQFFQWGMGLGSAWLGLPFLACVPVFGMMAVVSFVISTKDRDIGYIGLQSEDEEDANSEVGRTAACDDEPSLSHVP